MVKASFEKRFKHIFDKLKDNLMREKVKKQVTKIIKNPEIGKPLMYDRKRTRELYVKPFRLSYVYLKGENKVIFLDLYHKKRQ